MRKACNTIHKQETHTPSTGIRGRVLHGVLTWALNSKQHHDKHEKNQGLPGYSSTSISERPRSVQFESEYAVDWPMVGMPRTSERVVHGLFDHFARLEEDTVTPRRNTLLLRLIELVRSWLVFLPSFNYRRFR